MPERPFDQSMLEEAAYLNYGKPFKELSDHEAYCIVSTAVMRRILPTWHETNAFYKDKKQAYYLSAEYLMGRALGNNLTNLKLAGEVAEAVKRTGKDLDRIEAAEADAGLGNGGLGRLAACFLDSAATQGYPLTGYGLRYEYGIFRQKIINGMQVEEGDDWDSFLDPWSIRRESERSVITFADQRVYAVPYDMPIIGYGGSTINTLRLFTAEPLVSFNFDDFNQGNYQGAVAEETEARTISRVLYPNDTSKEGKVLRLKQQYFFTSAALQDLMRTYKQKGLPLENFFQYHAIQLNDTHPAVAVPELIRLLLSEGLDFDKAFDVTRETLAYTNHTILQEALEKWDVALYREYLPEIFQIIEKIQDKLTQEMTRLSLRASELEDLAIIDNTGNQIRMAYLAIYGSHSVNGVARLHTEILKAAELKKWYGIYPERFNNKTNGITQRRWLLKSNPELSEFITRLLGSEEWITDLHRLEGLLEYADQEEVLKEFMEIKRLKKRQLADHIRFVEGTNLDVNTIFDIQIKRIHEYKRQLMNAFHILYLYYRIKDKNQTAPTCKRTFIIGGKAAPGYYRAKGIIHFINEIKNLVDNDPDVKNLLEVVFVENYNVSYAELLFPAADISEQISTTGKEASGTGNMKFMLNGALTIGTPDGANVEIVEEAGRENNFIFGPTYDEMYEIRQSYDPNKYYQEVPGLKRVVDTLIDGTFSDDGTGAFKDIHHSLLHGQVWETPDQYMVLRDFEEYTKAHDLICEIWQEPLTFARMGFINMAKAGKFSSDRTLDQYAKEIWNVARRTF